MPDRTWDVFVELRKELVESQKIRSQIIGFKISFVSAAAGIIAARLPQDTELLVIPAFAAVLFDFLVYSYSFSIKRIGCYTRFEIEPALVSNGDLPEGLMPWQKFLEHDNTQQRLSQYGNVGFTALVVLVGCVSLFNPFKPVVSTLLLLALIAFSALSVLAAREPRRRLPRPEDRGPYTPTPEGKQ